MSPGKRPGGHQKGTILEPRRFPVILLALLLTACGGAAAPAPGAAGPAGAALQPQSGGTFALATRTGPLHKHPFETALGNIINTQALYDTLLKFDYSGDFRDEMKITPHLAERWELPTPNTYVFHLRKGVKFHDGSEMTAADVAWSLDHLRDPANRFRDGAQLREIQKVEVVDPLTVRVTTKGPSAGFIQVIADRAAVVLSKKAFDRGVDYKEEVVGTGPFKLTTFDRQSGAVLVKNADYWMPGRPYLDKVQLFYNLDAAASVAAFAAGKNDVVKVADKPQFDAIKATNPNAAGEAFPQTISDHLLPKIDSPPFSDINVRRAFHLALDRQEMLGTLTSGLGVINPPGMNGARKGGWAVSQDELLKLPGYRSPKEADLTEARRLLAQAGYANGFETTLSFNSGFTRYPGEAEVVAAHLAKIGVRVKLEPRENAVALKAEQDGDYRLTFAQFDYTPEPDWSNWLRSGGSVAKSGIRDAELDRLIDQQYVELDEAKRKKQWTDIQRLLMEKLYVFPLVTQVGFVAWHPYVHGWGENRAGQAVNMSWEHTWVETAKLPSGR